MKQADSTSISGIICVLCPLKTNQVRMTQFNAINHVEGKCATFAICHDIL